MMHELTIASPERRPPTPRVGGKGANLGEMARAGLPVPAGFVVTVDAFRAFLAHVTLGGRQTNGARHERT